MLKKILMMAVFTLALGNLSDAYAEAPLSVNETLAVHAYVADHPVARVLWIPSEYGVLPQEEALAKHLQQQGISVWIPDFFESYFLPVAPSSLRKVPPAVVTRWVKRLHQQEPKLPLFVIAPNQAAALAVKSLVQFQQTPQNMVGLILLNPNLYIETPAAGTVAEYWSAVQQVNLPIYVIQAQLSPWRWHLSTLQQKLSSAGSDVFVKLIPQVRDRYYFRPDAMAVEQQKAAHLKGALFAAMQTLSPYMKPARQAQVQVGAKPKPVQSQPADSKATIPVYKGEQNRPLVLEDLNGRTYNLADYKGQVVLVNFWASWCPPCVHEMPSMARLKKRLKGEPFEILAANLAEAPPAIDAFIKAHPVNFPILLDQEGSAVQAWKVFAYPSSYLIDKKGRIRYALFGGFDWDSPAALNKIEALLAETP